MKKPHKVVIKWEDSAMSNTTRSFATKKEVDAFLEGVKICYQTLGDGGYTYKYTDTTEKPLLFSDLGKKSKVA